MPKQRKTRKANSQAILAEVKNLAVMGAGVVLGAVSGRMVDKVLKTDPSATGTKALLRPVLMTGLGAYGAATMKHPMVRLLAAGVGASGILAGVKALTKTDILAGMEPFSGTGFGSADDVFPGMYNRPADLPMQGYGVGLPELGSEASPEEYDSDDGIAYIDII